MTLERPGKLFFAGIWLAAFTGAYESTGLGPSYPIIARELTSETNVAPYITSFTALSFASAVGLAGFIRKSNFLKWLIAATAVQSLGLLVCSFATSQFVFIMGRSFQGSGEGLITICIFFAFTQFLSDIRTRARAFASISLAWLLASVLTPLTYHVLENGSWRPIFGALVVSSIMSVVLAFMARPRLDAQVSTTMWPAAKQVKVRGWIILGMVTAAVFVYSQTVANFSGPIAVATVGAVVLTASVWLLLSGQLGLRVTRSRLMIETLMTRGMVSSVYALAMAFLSLTLYGSLGLTSVLVAVVTAAGAVGWTTGALTQTRLTKLRASSQLSIGLLALFLGVASLGLTINTGGNWPYVGAAVFIAGSGTGVATNSLPGFISDISTAESVAVDLSAAESVDTIMTTLSIAAVGVVLSPTLGSTHGAGTASLFYFSLALGALIVGLYVCVRGNGLRREELQL